MDKWMGAVGQERVAGGVIAPVLILRRASKCYEVVLELCYKCSFFIVLNIS